MQPRNEFLKQPAHLLKAIVCCLNQLISEIPHNSQSASLFDIKAAPTISVSDYLVRMLKYMNCSISVFVYSLILLDRAQQYNPQFIIHKKNIHRLLLVSNVLAAKYLDDKFYKNSFYANVGGIGLKVLNDLEIQFLHLINFNCAIQQDTFWSYLDKLQIFLDINQKQKELARMADKTVGENKNKQNRLKRRTIYVVAKQEVTQLQTHDNSEPVQEEI